MEPLDEKELSPLLRRWEAPNAPPSLERRVLPRRGSPWRWSWRWLLTGTIRVPVPVGIAAAVGLLGLWIYWPGAEHEPVAQPPASVTLADFQPVQQLEPTIVRR